MDQDYNPGDLVSVRSASPTWWPGVVETVDDVKIVVALDVPLPTGNEWSGMTLRYGGNMPVEKATIWRSSEAVSTPGCQTCHIKPRVGP